MSASLLTAVVSTRGKTRVALAANHLLAVVLLGEGGEGGLDHTTSHLEEHFNGGFTRNVVGTDGLSVVEFLAGENEALVVSVDVLLLLKHHLHRLHGLRGLDFKSKRSSRNSLDEKLHFSKRKCGSLENGRKMKTKRRFGDKCRSFESRLNLALSRRNPLFH